MYFSTKFKITDDTVAKYIDYLEEAFLFKEAKRFNIKGNKYYENIKKYYIQSAYELSTDTKRKNVLKIILWATLFSLLGKSP